MKLIILLLFISVFSTLFSQSKKKQIEILNRKIDSLNQRTIDFESQFLKTKSDLTDSLEPIKHDMMSMKADMKVMMFLMAGMFAGVGAILMKMLFPH